MRRGTLRIYLGAAPGVGKTYAMLSEGRRRAERGTDVVVAFVETHGRKHTAERLDGLEVVPRTPRTYRGASFEEMDTAAVLERLPEVALVDELAHTNAPGGQHEKRWQDVVDLLNAGIEVITTLNVQHLESVNDVVEAITGVPQRETVPDAVVRGAEQVELVDMEPDALRRRMAHGNVYPVEKIDAALGNYFRVGNLTALRELALLWLADKVDEQLERYRDSHEIRATWEARERVVVAVTGGPEGATLIRRGCRIAARGDADLLAVHVTRSDGLTGAAPGALAAQRALVESLGGSYHQVVGEDVTEALLNFARAENATQLVLGASRRPWLARMLSPGIGSTTIARSGAIDVHMVTHAETGRGRLPRIPRGALSVRRQLFAAAVTVAALPLLTVVLANARAEFNLTSDALAYLVAVVGIALLGGFWPAACASVAASLLLNYYFIPPVGRFTIAERNNVLALVAFFAVAAMVSRVVDLAARHTSQAARATAEAETLLTLAGSVLRGASALPALLERARETFGMRAALLRERGPSGWETVAASPSPPGSFPAATPRRPLGSSSGAGPGDAGAGDAGAGDAGAGDAGAGDAGPGDAGPGEATGDGAAGDIEVPVGDDLVLVLVGRPLPAEDRRVLVAFANAAAVAREQARLAEAAARAEPLAEAERTRTALLAAVSHDLRTPLASAKAAVSSLRDHEVAWTHEDRDELLATADESLDRLIRLVENLLDMSRLQAGALSVFRRPTGLDDVVALALDDLGPAGQAVVVRVPPELPAVDADPALLERVVVNLMSNALRYGSPSRPPVVSASALGPRVELRVADSGPGLPPAQRDRVFAPFQRLGDRDNTTGVGLGLALSRGLTEAMGGTLTPEDTPGGGLTMVIALPAAGGGASRVVIDAPATSGVAGEGRE